MAFHEYPYTDFHEMNLDWIIKQMKDLIDEWDSFGGNVEATAHESLNPEVSVSGDLKTKLDFDFGLVRGNEGPRGPEGPEGPQGKGLEIHPFRGPKTFLCPQRRKPNIWLPLCRS